MNTTPKNKKPMTKDEVSSFVDLIQSYQILTSKETNATTNKMKEEAWVSLTAAFNAKCGSFPKHKDQLKLKWDNLKKAARKRTQQIRMNNLKTGSGKSEFIPPDEILDKVASLLGSTCTGFEVLFGGDGIGGGCEILELEAVPVDHFDHRERVTQSDKVLLPSDGKKRKIDSTTPEDVSNKGIVGAKFLYGMPTFTKALQNKGKKKKQDEGRSERNLAIAKYYKLKAEKLELELKLLKDSSKENKM